MIIGYTVPEIWHRWIKLLFFILNYTFPFYTSCLLTAQKMKISKKWKKNPGDIIILQNCTKNHDHMLYCSWHMAHNRCNSYFSFCAIFCPLPPQQSEKWKFQKKPKNWRYHHFTQVYQKSWSYAILSLRYGMWRMQLFLFILGYFLPFYPHNSPKNEKKAWRYHHFTQVYQKSWSHGILFLRYDM